MRTRVTRRSEDFPEQDRIETSEYIEQVRCGVVWCGVAWRRFRQARCWGTREEGRAAQRSPASAAAAGLHSSGCSGLAGLSPACSPGLVLLPAARCCSQAPTDAHPPLRPAQIFDESSSSAPRIKASQCFTKYKWRSEAAATQDGGPAIVATQVGGGGLGRAAPLLWLTGWLAVWLLPAALRC
jgi:hypothetical protein